MGKFAPISRLANNNRRPLMANSRPPSLSESPISQRRDRLYVRVVSELMKEITAGVYPIGTRLPTELELCRRFNASRHTVREALRQLREAGLVLVRQGSGTTVTRRNVTPIYIHSAGSIAELMQYTAKTRLKIGKWITLRADAKLALRLDCSPRRKWYRAEGLRTAEWTPLPLCWTEIFIHHDYPKVKTQSSKRSGSIYGLFEELYDEHIVEVKQTLRAVSVPQDLAESLKCKPNTPALEIERVFKATHGRIVEVAISIHPMDRFTYSMTLRRDAESSFELDGASLVSEKQLPAGQSRQKRVALGLNGGKR